ncbi:hypothetical protein [Parafrankia elaeagni]|uniref:hypothetical protein n=1 Tax=Parafrankia elaeagni TaxID=222534 RepID=UPI000378859B|nr:hypothetical protein [Parafrankia elaeagni]
MSVTIVQQAFAQAGQSAGNSVDGFDVLFALATEPSGVRDLLADLGVTSERLRSVRAERVRMRSEQLGYDPAEVERDAGRATTLGPSAHEIKGRAEGFAFAWGWPETEREHWLLAVLYADPTVIGGVLVDLGTSAGEVVEELRRRGTRVPEVPAPRHRPWRGQHHLDVVGSAEPLLVLLRQHHPPGTEWRWAISYFPGDTANTRCRVHAEEGIDLRALLAEARENEAG